MAQGLVQALIGAVYLDGGIGAAERVLEGLAGRYLALLGDGEDERVYLDPVCDMAAVYDPVRRVVALKTVRVGGGPEVLARFDDGAPALVESLAGCLEPGLVSLPWN